MTDRFLPALRAVFERWLPLLTTFRAVLDRLLLLWLILVCAAAYWWVDWFGGTEAFDPFVWSGPGLPYLIFVTMLAIGSLLPEDEIRQVIQRWPTVLAGTAMQYAAMPLLAYATGRFLGLEGAWMIGIVMVGCVPGAMASNVLTLMARGNVSYSVSLTTSATILSPVVVPLVLWIALGRIVPNFPVGKAFSDLSLMVVIPVVTGHLLSRMFPRWAAGARHVGVIIANLTILWIIAVVVAKNRDQVSQLPDGLVAGLLAINSAGYLAGFLGGRLIRLPDPMRRALTLEIGMQNAGLGATLASRLFPDDPAAWLPAALYTFGCMFTGTILARLWAEWGRREEAGSE